ncbi:MAG: TraM recognition domain-containing protein [Acidimicrobiales bacterium]|jgi:type IV secretory pathway TraG/TraD family ATPase VirD4
MQNDPSRDALARVLAASVTHNHGIYLGAANGEPVFAPHEHGTLVLGPPRSGKTSGVIVPNVFAAAGAVVAVSTKRDVLDETCVVRGRRGECLLLDPSGTVAVPWGVHPIGWSPLTAAATWDGAVFMAESMVGASREGRDRVDGSHWTERAAALLSAVFHGAALGGASLDDVVSAVNRRAPEGFVATLARHDSDLALDLLVGITETEEREQSAIWSTASGVLAGYRTSAALASARLEPFDPERFVRTSSTLFVAAPAEFQMHLAPLVAGIIRDVRTAAYRHHAETPTRAGPPVLLVLDELANIAPLHDLPALVAEGASQGVVTLASLQDLSQARARFGTLTEGFLTLFGVKLVLGGMGDVRTLEALSALAGRRDEPVISMTASRSPGRLRRHTTRTVTTRREPRLPVDAIAQAPRGTAIAFIGARPLRVELTPHHSSSPWREVSARPLAPPPLGQPHPARLRPGPGGRAITG